MFTYNLTLYIIVKNICIINLQSLLLTLLTVIILHNKVESIFTAYKNKTLVSILKLDCLGFSL